MPHIEVTINCASQEIRDILIAELGAGEFEGFHEEGDTLKAYKPEPDFNESELKSVTEKFGVGYQLHQIPDTNWNSVWESNFQPVKVGGFCAIRATFHEPYPDVAHDIVIVPKMSFGTGHHPTTYMMVQQMEQLDFYGKKVFDFGTGTGILAILADKLGAEEIYAIDNDEWSIENAAENITRNQSGVKLEKADTLHGNGKYDIILANITKNILLAHLPALAGSLETGGVLLMSGLLASDEEEMVTAAAVNGLRMTNKLDRGSWICLRFERPR